MAAPKRAEHRAQLAVWIDKSLKEALFDLAALSGLSVTACLEAIIRDAQKKAGLNQNALKKQ